MPYGDYYDYASSISSSSDGYYYGSRARTGIFTDYWNKVEHLTKGYPGAQFKKFANRGDAEHYLFLRGAYENQDDDTDWYYTVAIGRYPGIYTFSANAIDQTSGYSGSRMKKTKPGDRHWHTKDRPLHVINPRDHDTLVTFCNGSALRSGNHSACAAFACIFLHNRSWDVVELLRNPPLTDNRAEYEAAFAVLECANEEEPGQKKPLFVYTHNELLIKTMRDWVHTWRNNGWRKSNGKPVKNQDLILNLLDLQGNRSVYWRHVRANAEVTSWVTFWKDVTDQRAKNFSRNADSF